ncbi:alpha-2-macroglobulin family protein [Fusobacterium canifelinum]|uniref:Alpha-2-macroglobulin family protein n=1 Tax=Fusobacterium canifelinum TaxID=285729 RepID=A0A3P1V141_9FUSO|nr:alpha-2-macroglobulin [Fusobacterium canifelinum]RRD27377.1 alpha-2-macroglobulin family protein [Fusobacterium canifelinum]
MKKILKLVFILSILTITFVACKKDKEQTQDNVNQPQAEQNYDYEKVLYINEARFNASGDLIVLFSEELDKTQNLKDFVEVEGLDNSNITIMPFVNKIIIKGNFQKDVAYSIKVSQGVKGISGTTLKNDFLKNNIYVNKKQPSLSFVDSGNVLPSINNKKINFNSVNISKVKLEVVKVYTNNITQYLKLYSNEYGINEWELKDDLGDVIFTKEYEIDSKEDQVIKNSIDLSNTIDTKGIYYVKLSAIGQDSIDYDIGKYGEPNSFGYDGDVIYARAEKTIILSDIGIVANSNNSKLDLKLLNLNTLNPISGARLEFINSKNQTLEEGTTNSNGEYKSKTNLDKVFYVLVKSGNEFNVLYLAGSKINYSDFDIGGSLDGSDLKLYTYTDKGYYRPGDEINVSLIARSKEKMNDNQPFEYSFTGPDGSTKINNEIVKESKNGFYTFKIKTDMNDLTGAWTLSIKFGGKEITQKVFIESKIANTIAIDTDEDKIYSKADVKDGIMDFKFFFKYLSGANVDKGSFVSFDYSVIEKDTQSKKYREYSFGNPSNYKYQFRSFVETTLDDDSGAVNLKLDMPETLQNKNLYLNTIVNVSDANGRYSTETKVFKIINRENSVGVQKVSQNENEASVKYILLNEKTDSLVAGKKLKYRVYNKEYNWWYDYYYNDGEKSFKENIETVLLEEGEITSASSPELLKVTKLGDGINFIEIEDEETGHSSGVFVYNYHYGDKNHGTIENLNITADKEKYNIGDIAKIKYSGAVGSKALITIEKDGKIIKEYWKTLAVKDNEETIVIEKDFFPNAYVNISVFQKYVDKQNDKPLRLYGSVPLMVDDKSKILTIQVDTKTEVLPGGDLKIKLSNKENKKMYYEVFLVDEGVLRMTNYKKPDPYKFFYEKRAKLVQSYDNFSNIIERYSDKVANRLKTGGGDFEEDELARPMAAEAAYKKEDMQLFGDAQRFANLTIFRGVAESNENGNAVVDVKLPNFFGTMRLFVVAVSDESYGSIEKSISVKAPIIVETSAPRVLKVGDKFTVPVTLFPIEKAIGDSEITLAYNGKTYNKKVNVKDGKSEKVLFELEAPAKVGTTKIDIDFKSSKYSYKDTINLNVDTNYPYQYSEKSIVLEPNQEFTLSAAEYKDFINGSVKSKLVLSSYQKLGIEKLIKSLLDYPYICLEQISSKGMAMLYIDNLTTDPIEKNDAKNEINTIIGKLNNNYQLRNGAFAYWPGSQEEGISTVYAIRFLIEAKEKGYYVPETMFEKSKEYLNSIAMRTDVPKIEVLYLLSAIGDPNVSEMNIVFDRYYKDISVVEKWRLLAAYSKIGEKDFARKEADKLPRKAERKDGSYYADDSAEILKYYTVIYGTADADLYNSVLAIAKSDAWLTTYEKANIVQALAGDGKVSPEKKNLSFELVVDGKEQNLELKDGEYTFRNLGVKENVKKIVIKNTSSSKLYVNSFYKGKPVKYDEKDESKNITITRKFVDMAGKEIDVKNLKAGTRFKMILTSKLANADSPDISLLQILPSGWEFDNTQTNIQSSGGDMIPVPENAEEVDNQEYGESSSSNNVNYVDIKDDRVAYFYPLYSGEEKVIEINLIAVTPGTYRLPGTKVESMYNNNYRAYLKGFEVKVKE